VRMQAEMRPVFDVDDEPAWDEEGQDQSWEDEIEAPLHYDELNDEPASVNAPAAPAQTEISTTPAVTPLAASPDHYPDERETAHALHETDALPLAAPAASAPPTKQSPAAAASAAVTASAKSPAYAKADPDELESLISPNELPENLVPLSYLVAPARRSSSSEAEQAQMLKVVLRSSGDKNRDIRRLHRVHGLLHACPGKDRFSFLIFENGHYFLMEFPNDTVQITQALCDKVADLVGEDNLRIEQIKLL